MMRKLAWIAAGVGGFALMYMWVGGAVEVQKAEAWRKCQTEMQVSAIADEQKAKLSADDFNTLKALHVMCDAYYEKYGNAE